MNDEDTLRAVLREISEEVEPVNLADQVIRGATRRRLVLTAAGTFAAAAIALGALPLAFAANSNTPVGTTPTTTGPAPTSPAHTRPAPTGPVPGTPQATLTVVPSPTLPVR